MSSFNWSTAGGADGTTAMDAGAQPQRPLEVVDTGGAWSWQSRKVDVRCIPCDTLLEGYRGVARHRLEHHTEPEPPMKYECAVCHARFRLEREARQHGRRVHSHVSPAHPTVPPFRCKVCGQSFVDEQARNWHFNKHGSKPFSCLYCGEAFFLEQARKDHMREQHPLEVPVFPCDFPGCGQSFPCCCDLHAHSRAHTEPYSCVLCPVQHEDRHHYEDHLAAHMGIVSLSRVHQLGDLMTDAVKLSADVHVAETQVWTPSRNACSSGIVGHVDATGMVQGLVRHVSLTNDALARQNPQSQFSQQTPLPVFQRQSAPSAGTQACVQAVHAAVPPRPKVPKDSFVSAWENFEDRITSTIIRALESDPDPKDRTAASKMGGKSNNAVTVAPSNGEKQQSQPSVAESPKQEVTLAVLKDKIEQRMKTTIVEMLQSDPDTTGVNIQAVSAGKPAENERSLEQSAQLSHRQSEQYLHNVQHVCNNRISVIRPPTK